MTPGDAPVLGDAKHVVRGTIIFRQGDPGDDMFVLERGKVSLTLASEGAQTEVALLEPGDFFGELSLLSGAPRTATAEAVEDSTLLAIRRDVFALMMQDDLDIVFRMMNVLGTRLGHTNRQLETLMREAPRETPAAAPLPVATPPATATPPAAPAPTPMPVAEAADDVPPPAPRATTPEPLRESPREVPREAPRPIRGSGRARVMARLLRRGQVGDAALPATVALDALATEIGLSEAEVRPVLEELMKLGAGNLRAGRVCLETRAQLQRLAEALCREVA
jgi:CRP-like cAMP-binding protein